MAAAPVVAGALGFGSAGIAEHEFLLTDGDGQFLVQRELLLQPQSSFQQRALPQQE